LGYSDQSEYQTSLVFKWSFYRPILCPVFEWKKTRWLPWPCEIRTRFQTIVQMRGLMTITNLDFLVRILNDTVLKNWTIWLGTLLDHSGNGKVRYSNDHCIRKLQWGSKYSNHLNTGHICPVFKWYTSLDHFMYKSFFFYIKKVSLAGKSLIRFLNG
jgi:hypothetical protein